MVNSVLTLNLEVCWSRALVVDFMLSTQLFITPDACLKDTEFEEHWERCDVFSGVLFSKVSRSLLCFITMISKKADYGTDQQQPQASSVSCEGGSFGSPQVTSWLVVVHLVLRLCGE